ncbi:MAG: PTS glucose transporter subunit IIA [Floccifex sp.]
MLGLFKKKESFQDNDVIAIVDGKIIDITTVKDEMFSKKVLGDGIAFICQEDKVTICSPANGKLSAFFPTGHAFGVTMKNGVEWLIHIGIDTVSSNGKGFTALKQQGDIVKAGEPVVKVDMAYLRELYDMPIFMVVTNSNGYSISMPSPKDVIKKEKLFTL